jgi:hypothetical protein
MLEKTTAHYIISNNSMQHPASTLSPHKPLPSSLSTKPPFQAHLGPWAVSRARESNNFSTCLTNRPRHASLAPRPHARTHARMNSVFPNTALSLSLSLSLSPAQVSPALVAAFIVDVDGRHGSAGAVVLLAARTTFLKHADSVR